MHREICLMVVSTSFYFTDDIHVLDPNEASGLYALYSEALGWIQTWLGTSSTPNRK